MSCPLSWHNTFSYVFTRNPGQLRAARVFELPDTDACIALVPLPIAISSAMSRLQRASLNLGNAILRASGFGARSRRRVPWCTIVRSPSLTNGPDSDLDNEENATASPSMSLCKISISREVSLIAVQLRGWKELVAQLCLPTYLWKAGRVGDMTKACVI